MPDFSAANTAAFGRLQARLAKIQNPDATALMVAWEKIIVEDNREGVLAGTDKDGMPLYPVSYRPKAYVERFAIYRGNRIAGYGFRKRHGGAELTAAQRLGQAKTRKRNLLFGGLGPQVSGWNNNLTHAEYERLAGPPLAPRGQFSRVISNLRTGHSRDALNRWSAFGYWDEVVDKEGRPFLKYHFEGQGRLPRRDLRGVRPAGRERARLASIAWARDFIFSASQ